jgi:DNA mismatch repair protein MutL
MAMMAGKIRVLPEIVAQKIAAGEVVERPASVVKELIENSIDAGATEIVVELKSGGLQLIRVADNGEGMSVEDVPLSLQRFATSKIREAEDLYALETLGFRGEALPSIASVSKMVLRTRPSDSLSGAKVVCEAGEIKSLSEAGCPVGTEVEVHDLFYNFPVRRKFLKSIRTELRYALLHFHRISLAHPSITFKFIHDGRLLEQLSKTESLLVRVEAILGKETISHLRAIRHDDDEVRVAGFTSLPSLVRANRDGISTYIHGRYVKDRILFKSVLEAYRHILPADKYPVSILLITLPPSSVDVNVHPTKTEVRFKEPEKIYQAVWSSIRGALEESPAEEMGLSAEPFLSFPDSWKPYSKTHGEWFNVPRVEEKGIPWEAEKRRPYRIVGQLWETYILCETGGAIVFIDQHAAHERIVYERLKKKYEDGALATETLLLPVLMELSLEEALVLESCREAFEAIGFEIESAGERLYAIRSMPSFIEQKEAVEKVREMLGELSFLRRGGEGTSSLQALLISAACHSAIRADFRLGREEIEALIGDLYPFNPSLTCPHGRPVFFILSLDAMNRQFKRT